MPCIFRRPAGCSEERDGMPSAAAALAGVTTSAISKCRPAVAPHCLGLIQGGGGGARAQYEEAAALHCCCCAQRSFD